MESFEDFYQKHSKSRSGIQPAALRLLAIYYFIRASGYLISEIRMGFALQRTYSAAIPVPLIFILCTFLTLLLIIAGTGLWKGTPRGWWTGAFFHFSIITFSLIAFLFMDTTPRHTISTGRGLVSPLAKSAFIIFINFLLLLYLFKDNVYQYLGMNSVSKPKAIGILLIMTVVGAGVFNALWVLFS